jgi:CBS domain-containing protein
MDHRVYTADSTETLADAAVKMARANIGCVLIIQNDSLSGILTERDIVRALSQSKQSPIDLISQWMTKDPITVSPTEDIEVVKKLMLKNHFRHLPVVSDNGKVVGMISIRDLIKA